MFGNLQSLFLTILTLVPISLQYMYRCGENRNGVYVCTCTFGLDGLLSAVCDDPDLTYIPSFTMSESIYLVRISMDETAYCTIQEEGDTMGQDNHDLAYCQPTKPETPENRSKSPTLDNQTIIHQTVSRSFTHNGDNDDNLDFPEYTTPSLFDNKPHEYSSTPLSFDEVITDLDNSNPTYSTNSDPEYIQFNSIPLNWMSTLTNEDMTLAHLTTDEIVTTQSIPEEVFPITINRGQKDKVKFKNIDNTLPPSTEVIREETSIILGTFTSITEFGTRENKAISIGLNEIIPDESTISQPTQILVFRMFMYISVCTIIFILSILLTLIVVRKRTSSAHPQPE